MNNIKRANFVTAIGTILLISGGFSIIFFRHENTISWISLIVIIFGLYLVRMPKIIEKIENQTSEIEKSNKTKINTIGIVLVILLCVSFTLLIIFGKIGYHSIFFVNFCAIVASILLGFLCIYFIRK